MNKQLFAVLSFANRRSIMKVAKIICHENNLLYSIMITSPSTVPSTIISLKIPMQEEVLISSKYAYEKYNDLIQS